MNWSIVKYNYSRVNILFTKPITLFKCKSLKKNMMCSDFVGPLFNINAYLCESIIAAIMLILVLSLMIGCGLYLCHHEYSVTFWGPTDASSTYIMLYPSSSSLLIKLAKSFLLSLKFPIDFGALCFHFLHLKSRYQHNILLMLNGFIVDSLKFGSLWSSSLCLNTLKRWVLIILVVIHWEALELTNFFNSTAISESNFALSDCFLIKIFIDSSRGFE